MKRRGRFWGKLDAHCKQLITTALCPVFKITLQIICGLPKEAWEKNNEDDQKSIKTNKELKELHRFNTQKTTEKYYNRWYSKILQ